MKRKRIAVSGLVLLIGLLLAVAAWGTDAEMYFSSDKNGENRVTKVQEGDQIWIVVLDPDEDIDCDVRDKVWTDIKVMDIKTGAHIVWRSYIDQRGVDTDGDGVGNDVFYGDAQYTPHMGHFPGPSAGDLGTDFLEETNSSTGLFVSRRPFQVGTRVEYSDDGRTHSHIVGPYEGAIGGPVEPTDFKWGGYLYADSGDPGEIGDERVWVTSQGTVFQAATVLGREFPFDPFGSDSAYLPPGIGGLPVNEDYMLGRFENMDTLIGLYVDQNEPGDVALTLAKIDDTEASIEWGREVYRDANEAAMVTIIDPDENLNCDAIEFVPVFILVNPGSWNPVQAGSPTNFCELKRIGGVVDLGGTPFPIPGHPFEWFSLYDSGLTILPNLDLAGDGSDQPNVDGTYYIEYPTEGEGNVTWFDTASDSGVTRVMFYAQETSADSGVFQLNLNSILVDLGFDSLEVRDVLVAYYIDPNDQDDFKLATAYIEEKNHSQVKFTDHAREDETVFWIGRNPVYVEVVDANANTDSCCPEKVVVHICDPHEVDDSEWLILDELSSNSPVFFTYVGMRLISVWDALGVGEPGKRGGYSLELDNWELEAFNEDSIYVRYNDAVYTDLALSQLGDLNIATAFPPEIREARVDNDVSFALLEVGDTQVFDGSQTTMYFLDRNGNRVTGYFNSDCVFVSVIDPDQDEDQQRRERISGLWDEHQNIPHAPVHYPDNREECRIIDDEAHLVNHLLGDTDIFEPFDGGGIHPDEINPDESWPKLYVLNPRNGRWASFDLLETGVDSGEFVSVACIDLVSRYECAPSLGVLPGDTIIAAYQDPSNHSDVAWISIKVGIGGAGATLSSTSFVDASGDSVAAYIEGEPIYVKVIDPSVADAGTLPDAVTIDGVTYDLKPLVGAAAGTFITEAINLAATAGDTIEASYVDPTDTNDTSSASVPIVAGEFSVERFFATPTPFADNVTFGYAGSGLAEEFTVAVYDLRGHRVWSADASDVLSITWDGRGNDSDLLANGAYIYVVAASRGDDVYTAKETLFILR